MENQIYFPISTSSKIRWEAIFVSYSKIKFDNQFEKFLNAFIILYSISGLKRKANWKKKSI